MVLPASPHPLGGPLRACPFGPTLAAVCHLLAVLGGRPQMPSGAEGLGDGSIRREKPLGMTSRFASLHAILTLPRGTMQMLTPSWLRASKRSVIADSGK